MPYSKFTLPELKKKFGLQIEKVPIFNTISGLSPSQWLSECLELSHHISLVSEKAKSESIVFPILMELLKRNEFQISLFSGVLLEVDKKMGLIGECDFIISSKPNAYYVESPIISLVEAKDDDIPLGIPQCIAQMYAAQQFNQNENNAVDIIFGCVTTGTEWQFLQLKDLNVSIHNVIIAYNELPHLLGIWQHIINYYKK